MKEVINTEGAPKAIGAYSQAISAGNYVFISGQLPIHPVNGQIDGDIKTQTSQAIKNIEAILKSQGLDLKDVVKTAIYLKDINDFNSMNEVYRAYFNTEAPARVCVEVSRIPRDALVEIESIAYINSG